MKTKIDERNIMANNRRITSAISNTVDKQYTEFIATYPELSSRFPQRVVASYLGTNKDTLSRIISRLTQ